MRRRELLQVGALAPFALAGAANAATPAAPAKAKPAEVMTGGARMITLSSGHKVWTKRVGRGAVKVLLLHGGPGVCHDYLECFEDFLPGAGIEFYYYDQLGCGNSDKPTDASLWTLSRYLDEVEEVRKGLGLERFVLYGHSWGGLLGYEYALKHPERLSGLVISNMTAGIPAYVAYMQQLRARLDPAEQAVLAKYEALGQFEAPEYQDVVFKRLYTEHLCRLADWPEPLTRAFGKLNAQVYGTMQGPNEFVVTGNLKNWERWADLPKIRTRTLVMAARHDEMNPADMQRVAASIPGARLFMSERGSHLAMYDDQQAYFGALVPFLKSTKA